MSNNEERTLTFPINRSVGWVKVPKKGPDPLNNWEMLSDATGRVFVPMETPVRLVVESSSTIDLSWMQALQPQDLSELYLVQTQVDNSQLAHVGRLTGLQKLTLSHTYENISDSGVASLQSLLQLRELYLNATNVSDTGLSYLQGLGHLEVLSLGATHISDVGLPYLYDLPSLRIISFDTAYSGARKSNITPTGLSLLQKALPNCKLITDSN